MLPYRRFCGKTVQGHRIEKCVGVGGSGVVFKAIAPDGKPVALKLLRPLRETYDLDKVWREVEPLNCRAHPSIPEWLGIVRDGRAYFIVLSWMPGDTLETWLFEKRHVFDSGETLEVAVQLLDALIELHESGLAQGDLRPANVLYDGTRVSLVDFGLSGGVADMALDVAGFADIVIYLLYSSFRPPGRNRPKSATWREELSLTNAQRAFLSDALEHPQDVRLRQVRDAFLEAFGAQQAAELTASPVSRGS